MIPRHISSLQHPLVKHLVKLRENRAWRLQENRVVVVGEAVVREIALHRKLKILISEHPLDLAAEEAFCATSAVMKKVVGLATHDPVAAVFDLPPPASLETVQRLVVLEGLQDPGNVGTILRTALALGWEGAFLTSATADPFNDKALRAARGAPLLLPLRQGSLEELKAVVQHSAMKIYIADVHGQPLEKTDFKLPLALILGHETQGPSSEAKTLGTPISIPMTPPMESLNVASAAAIIIYNLRKLS